MKCGEKDGSEFIFIFLNGLLCVAMTAAVEQGGCCHRLFVQLLCL